MLGYAISIAAKAHEGQKDKGGFAYILHPLRVMNSLNSTDKDLCSIAVMHDVVEDSDITLEDIKGYGFSIRVQTALRALTHLKGETYQEYIERCYCNSDARLVKMADLRDNSDITRLKGITSKDLNRMEKYHKAYMFLSHAQND